MQEELETLISVRNTYLEQVRKLKEEWRSGTGASRFSNKKDFLTQLKIWEKRIAEYNTKIEKLKIDLDVVDC